MSSGGFVGGSVKVENRFAQKKLDQEVRKILSPRRGTRSFRGDSAKKSERSDDKKSRRSGISGMSGRSGLSGLKSLNGLGNVASLLKTKNALMNVSSLSRDSGINLSTGLASNQDSQPSLPKWAKTTTIDLTDDEKR